MGLKNLRLTALLVGALFFATATNALSAPVALAPLGGVPPGQSSASGTISAPGSAQVLSLAAQPTTCSVTLSGATTFNVIFQVLQNGQWQFATNLGSSGTATAAGYYSGAVDPTKYTSFSFSVTSITAGQVLTYSESCPASGGGGGGGGSTLTFGTHLTGGSYNGTLPVTLGTDAVATSTASTIVSRDASKNFAANIITATLSGQVIDPIATGISAAGTDQGSATALTKNFNEVTTVASGTGVVLQTGTAGGTVTIANRGANALAVYPASGAAIDALAANAAYTIPAGGLASFTASTATQWYVGPQLASYVNDTDDNSTNAVYCPVFQTVITAAVLKTGCSALTYNPSSGTLAATTFSGALAGNATTATTATTATSAINLTTTEDSSTNASYCPPFQTASGGTNPFKTDCANLTYNPSTGTITSSRLILNNPNASRAACFDSSHRVANCGSNGIAPDFALAGTCSATLSLPCAFTWTCTMSSGNCTTTQAVPASSRCLLTPNVSPDLSATNVVSTWVTLASTTATIHVSDLLGTSSAVFSGNGMCL